MCPILNHDASIGLDEALERSGDVPHVRWTAEARTELRVRSVSALSARDGRVRWARTLPEPVAGFPRAFEIGFDDLADALDDINPLIVVQTTLEDLTGGACYNTWNENLTMPDERDARHTPLTRATRLAKLALALHRVITHPVLSARSR